MACVVKDPNGLKRVQWTDGDGHRRTLRMGNVSQKQADAVRVRIEQVLASRSTGILDVEAARWLESLDDDMYGKLVRLALVPARDTKVSTLGELMDHFFKTVAVKDSTKASYAQTRLSMEAYFPVNTPLSAITSLDCDLWRQSMVEKKLAVATIAKRVKVARQIFRQAMRWKLLKENPLAEVRAGSMSNRSRMAFVTREMTDRVLAECPDVQWRLIISLARYGGVRVPSELLPLRWSDIDFEKSIIHVRSVKTERFEGRDSRVVPMFPELRPLLLEAFESAPPGTQFVITRYRESRTNLRTQMLRWIKMAGLTPWPRVFQNLRSSRQTELAEEYPVQCVCQWIGNSVAVAREAYLQVTPEHLARAIAPKPGVAGHVASPTSEGGHGTDSATRRDSGQRGGNGASVAA